MTHFFARTYAPRLSLTALIFSVYLSVFFCLFRSSHCCWLHGFTLPLQTLWSHSVSPIHYVHLLVNIHSFLVSLLSFFLYALLSTSPPFFTITGRILLFLWSLVFSCIQSVLIMRGTCCVWFVKCLLMQEKHFFLCVKKNRASVVCCQIHVMGSK